MRFVALGRRGRRTLSVFCVAVAVAGCATKGDVKDLERSMISEIQDLQAEQRALMDRIGVAFDSLSEQERRELTGRGELQRQFDRLHEVLAQLLDLVSQNNQLLAELRDRPPATAAGDVSPGEARTGGAPSPGGGAPPAASDEATIFYTAALGQYRRGSFSTARTGFEDFLRNYPDHELAPDAQYFLAETYASEEKPERALREFSRVWEQWPDSPRAATALYRSGVLEVERGRLSDAQVFFDRVLAGYPNSAEAPLARDQLNRIRRR